MITRRLVIALAAVFAWTARASSAPDHTADFFNGRWWRDSGEAPRTYLIIGLVYGVSMTLNTLSRDKSLSAKYLSAKSDTMLAERFTYGEVVEQIDKLYNADPGNGIIPVTDMYRIAVLALKGTLTPENIASTVRDVRAAYAQ